MAFQQRETRPLAEPAVITDARLSRSEDISRREIRYLVTMAFRTACFGIIFLVPGWWKMVVIAGAAILPPIAVVLGNAQDNRSLPMARPEEPQQIMPQLTTGQEVISGEFTEVDRG